ncbi:hypothetical protein [Maritalea sp.]|uniref:hypothetical protein n=1 Tax=Maritalea sp. TaxID=2003361 RepID=UPI003EF932A5
MPKKPLNSFFDLLNIRQHLREIDPNIHDDAGSLGIYAREFRLPHTQDNAQIGRKR